MARAAICFSLLLSSASASSMFGKFKDMGCSMMKVPLVCSGSGSSSSGSSASKCSGPDCCAASSCYKIPQSMFECKADRGPTECVGAGMFPPSAGVCKCKYGSCSIAGICPSSRLRLYEATEEEVQVTPEDFTMAFAGLGLSFFCALFLSAVLVTRLRRRGQTVPAGAEALVAASDDDEAVSTLE